MMQQREIAIDDLAALERAAARLAPHLAGGLSVGLLGALGAGKTTFVRSVCAALGVTDPVSSPTYVLAHEYRGPDGRTIEHWDLYRVDSLPEELMEPPDAATVRLIEWADRIPGFLTELDATIELTMRSDTARVLRLRTAERSFLDALIDAV